MGIVSFLCVPVLKCTGKLHRSLLFSIQKQRSKKQRALLGALFFLDFSSFSIQYPLFKGNSAHTFEYSPKNHFLGGSVPKCLLDVYAKSTDKPVDFLFVIPVKVGIQPEKGRDGFDWIPAFARMTKDRILLLATLNYSLLILNLFTYVQETRTPFSSRKPRKTQIRHRLRSRCGLRWSAYVLASCPRKPIHLGRSRRCG